MSETGRYKSVANEEITGLQNVLAACFMSSLDYEGTLYCSALQSSAGMHDANTLRLILLDTYMPTPAGFLYTYPCWILYARHFTRDTLRMTLCLLTQLYLLTRLLFQIGR